MNPAEELDAINRRLWRELEAEALMARLARSGKRLDQLAFSLGVLATMCALGVLAMLLLVGRGMLCAWGVLP